MTREFIGLPEFLNRWYKAGLNDNDLCELELYLCKYPEKGVLIKGTDGLRKIRWKRESKGKSGGMRVLYVDFLYFEKIYLISVYTKSDKANISNREKKDIKKLIELLKNELERKRIK
ncbi:MAG TPA: type II toxin-antitoxin system RelE/ParE family toxin [Candidatus Eremiobacteraeota bacterium]|nr:MAG: Toxin HigB-2 [bacterium ADurb.Bin363]HPZ07185.1 type II toxin-antitoxin system RelE/ParE family toxin [Candidatus Eremiobacteraeota bacterium]